MVKSIVRKRITRVVLLSLFVGTIGCRSGIDDFILPGTIISGKIVDNSYNNYLSGSRIVRIVDTLFYMSSNQKEMYIIDQNSIKRVCLNQPWFLSENFP